MDISFSEFKKKDVIDVSDGKKLGKAADILFTFPEGKIKTVTVSCGFMGMGDGKTFAFKDIERIGADAVLVNTGKKEPPCPPPHGRDKNCAPCDFPPRPDDNCPPPRPNCKNPAADLRLDLEDYE